MAIIMKNIIFLFAILVSIFACNSSPNKNMTAQANPEIVSEKTSRELVQLNFSGSGYELGMQHGKALEKEISEIVSKWKENTSRQLGREADEVLAEFFEYAQFTQAIKKWTPELYEEVRGIAEGSGQNFNDIFVLNLLDEFWVYLNNIHNHHCSDIGVPSVNGSPSYVAQNMDIEEYTDGYQILIRLNRTAERPEQLILTHPGLIGLNGMNEEGVGVCVNTIMQLKASSDGLPVAFVIRRIINSTDKEDILQFTQTVNHASGQNYIIGIRGEIYDFEASANEVVRFQPENTNGAVYHTNHPIVNTDLKEWFSDFHPASIDSAAITKSNSYIRLASLEKRIATDENIDDEIIKETLRSKDDGANPVCRSNSNSNRGFTFASVIMSLSGTPYLQVTAGPPDESEYKKINFTE